LDRYLSCGQECFYPFKLIDLCVSLPPFLYDSRQKKYLADTPKAACPVYTSFPGFDNKVETLLREAAA